MKRKAAYQRRDFIEKEDKENILCFEKVLSLSNYDPELNLNYAMDFKNNFQHFEQKNFVFKMFK